MTPLRTKSFFLFFLFSCLCLGLLAATPPGVVNYQGVLRDASGNALDGTYDMAFRFFDGSDSGTATLLLTDTHAAAGSGAVTVSGGLFNVGLGSGTLTAGSEADIYGVFRNNASVWIEVQIGAETLAPLVEVRSAGYALNAGTLDGMDSTDFLAKDAADTSSADANTVYSFENTRTSGSTVLFLNQSNTDAANGAHHGIRALSQAGDSDGTGGFLYSYGVSGSSSGASRVAGGNTLAHGVSGIATGTPVASSSQTNYGVHGRASGGSDADNHGVYGWANGSTSGSNYGVYGLAQSSTDENFGLYGRATGASGTNYGVRSTAGGSASSYGVRSTASGTGTNYGVFAEAYNGTTNWGFYTPHDAFIGGTLDIGFGSDDDLTAGDVTDLTDGGDTSLHIHDSRYFAESEFLNASAGAGDGGKPVVLNASGFIDGTMLDISGDYLAKDAQDTSTATINGDMYRFENAGTSLPSVMYLLQTNNAADNGTHYGLHVESRAGDQAVDGLTLQNHTVFADNKGASQASGASTNTTGVLGQATGTGVAGSSQSNRGVVGKATGNNNTFNYGTRGDATGTTSSSNFGAYGTAQNGNNNFGVYGTSFGNTGDKYGVFGITSGTGTNYGVYGTASGGTTDWGLYTPDNAFVGGTLDLGGGANDDLTAADVTDLTDNGDTALHHHDSRYYTETELDGGQLNSLYFTESEFLNTSAGAGDAGKPVVLNASGLIDDTMLDLSADFLAKDAADTSTANVSGTMYQFDNTSTTTPTTLQVVQSNTAASNGTHYALHVESYAGDSSADATALESYGVFADAKGAAQGSGTQSTSTAVFGQAVADTVGGGFQINRGLYGLAGGTTATYNYGVRGEATGTNASINYGLYGLAENAGNNHALYALAQGDIGTKWGALIKANGAGTNYGIFVEAAGGSTNWAIFTNGDIFAGGTVDFGGGNDDDLTAADVTDLTDGGNTSLHIHDDRYFAETEFLNSSAGAGDAGKPVVLNASGQIDATMLTSVDADQVDGLEASQFLRSDADDTAAGQITISKDPNSTALTDASLLVNPATAGSNEYLIGAAVNGNARMSLTREGELHVSSRFSTGNVAGIQPNVVANIKDAGSYSTAATGLLVSEVNFNASATLPVVGLDTTASASGATNSAPVYGLRAHATGASDATGERTGVLAEAINTTAGDNIGVEGQAGGGVNNYAVLGTASLDSGTKYAVRGEATGAGTNFGLYGTASGGTTNWGLFTPDNGAIGEDFYLGHGSGSDNDSLFFDAGGQALVWDNTNSQFELSTTLVINGVINTASTSPSWPYNDLGNGLTESGAMGSNQDLMVADDVEVGGELYLSGALYMNGTTTTLQDGNQFIYFYEGDSATGETFGWNDASNGFQFSDDLFFGQNTTINTTSDGLLDFSVEGVNIDFVSDSDNDETTFASFRWYSNGNGTSDRLLVLKDNGDLLVDGAVSPNQAFDVAEGFWMSEPVQPGELVRLDPQRADGILPSTANAAQGLLGVVSTNPGLHLGGSVFSEDQIRSNWGEEALFKYRQIRQDLETELLSSHPGLGLRQANLNSKTGPQLVTAQQALAQDLEEAALDLFVERYTAPVALAGRVPVKVEGVNGPIFAGDMLSAGTTPGRAAKAVNAGPVIGTALEDWDGQTDTILMFVHRGWFAPAGGSIADLNELRSDLLAELDQRTVNPATGLQVVEGNMGLVLDKGGDDRSRFSVFRDGGEGVAEEVLRVDEEGNLYTRGSVRPSGMDLAEYHPVSRPARAGDLLCMDPDRDAFLPCSEAHDPTLVGVVSDEPGVLMGSGFSRITAAAPELAARLDLARERRDRVEEAELWQQLEERFEATHAPLALSGTVVVKVDATYGAIHKGDLLVASATPGHAMASADPQPGTVLGKALDNHEQGRGIIRVLIMLR